MTKEEKKLAMENLRRERQEILQNQWDENYEKLRESLSPEVLADAKMRGMDGKRDIKEKCEHMDLFQYVYEIKEVQKATERMKLIDKTISEMSPEEQDERLNRMAGQKRAALTDLDLYLVSEEARSAWDAYDAWGYPLPTELALVTPQLDKEGGTGV
jgi:hypothetical protein